MFCCHPRRDFALLRNFAVVSSAKGLPRDMTGGSGVNGFIKVFVIEEGWCVTAFSPMCCPALPQLVDVGGCHLSLGEKEFGELELRSTFVGSPIVGTDIISMWTGRGSRG